MNTTTNNNTTKRRMGRLVGAAAVAAVAIGVLSASPASAGGKSCFPSYGEESSSTFGASTASGSDNDR